jgi:hypothetical protein
MTHRLVLGLALFVFAVGCGGPVDDFGETADALLPAGEVSEPPEEEEPVNPMPELASSVVSGGACSPGVGGYIYFRAVNRGTDDAPASRVKITELWIDSHNMYISSSQTYWISPLAPGQSVESGSLAQGGALVPLRARNFFVNGSRPRGWEIQVDSTSLVVEANENNNRLTSSAYCDN